MMNKNLGISLIILTAVAVIVGAILFQTVAQQVGTTTNTETLTNYQLATVVNGTPQYITSHKSISSVVVRNQTNGTVGFVGGTIGAGNYSVANNVVYNGALAIQITPTASADYKNAWFVSGTVQPLTYISDSGGRAVAGLVTVFFALLVALVAFTPVGEGLRDWVGK